MIPYAQALEHVISRVYPLETETVGLSRLQGRVLAVTLHAPRDVPPYDNSAMDGYAVRVSESQAGAELEIVGEIPAGPTSTSIDGTGQALHIMTGGELPKGANAVIRVEDVEELVNRKIRLKRTPALGENIRRHAEEFREGEEILPAGTRFSPYSIALAASMGWAEFPVRRRPRVAILATGSELLEPGAPYRRGVIYNSNAPALSELVRRDGGEVVICQTVSDDPKALLKALSEALDRSEIVLSSGGVSMGKYDHMPEVANELGLSVIFHRVAIRPGKPLLFCVTRDAAPKFFFGLPGNPVSSAVTYEIFARPVLERMLAAKSKYSVVRVRLDEDVEAKPGLTHFVRAVVTARDTVLYARQTGLQASNMLSSLSRANAILVLESETGTCSKSSVADALILDNLQ